jgi:hypothetical protein
MTSTESPRSRVRWLVALIGAVAVALGTALLTGAQPAAAATYHNVTSDTYGSEAVHAAESQIGRKYVWGGGNLNGPTSGGFDCAGLVWYAYGRAGMNLGGDYTQTEYDKAMKTYHATRTTSQSKAHVGDLIFFYSAHDDPRTVWHHVGIYTGGGKMINAFNTGTKVRVEPVSDADGTPYYLHIARISSKRLGCTSTNAGTVCVIVTQTDTRKFTIAAEFHAFYGHTVYAGTLLFVPCTNSSSSTCGTSSVLHWSIAKRSAAYFKKSVSATAAWSWVAAVVTFNGTGVSGNYRLTGPSMQRSPF